MSSLAEARPSGEDRGEEKRRTWYEWRITEESSLSSAVLTKEKLKTN